MTLSTSAVALTVQSCAFWNLAAYGVGGAALGWFMGGAFADTRNETVRRRQRQLALTGALIGTVVGVAEAVRRECITRRARK